MENPGSSIISALGAGSGVDFAKLADDLSEASFAFRRDTLETRNSDLEARISAASVLRGALTNLSGALGDRIRTGDLAPQPRIDNAQIADVSSVFGARPSGSYSLEVTQLAQGQTLVSPGYTSGEDLVGEGTLTVRFGTVSGSSFAADGEQDALDIEISAEDTLEDVARKISQGSDGALDSYVAEGADGAQLVIKGRDGAANGFTLETASGGGSGAGDLSYLAWSPASDNGELRQTSRDAVFMLDTVEMSSPSNQVTDLPEGITLDLKATNQGAPTTLSFTNNPAAITGLMNDFVTTLNDVVGVLNSEGASRGGTLANDPGVRELRRDLGRLTNEIVMPGVEEGEPNRLADLGLSLNRDGTFQLDSDRLARTLADNPEGVAAMFTTGPRGVFATIDKLARDNTRLGDPGSLGGSVTRYEAQMERNDERLERIAEQQDNLRARLVRDLSAAQSSIATSQSTLSFIRQQFEISDE